MEILKSLKKFTLKFPIESFLIDDHTQAEIFKNPHSPTVSIVFSFRDGVLYEPYEEWGISHFIEHILFRGTKKFPTLYELSRAVEGMGGQVSAFSTRDMTAIWIKVLSGCEDTALTVMEELLTAPLLKEEYIDSERLIIHQERQRELNNPSFFTSLLLECLLLLPEPVCRHPVGKDEFINKINGDLLGNYIKKFYHKKNMAIAVAGNTKKNFIKKLEGMLKKFPQGETVKKAGFKINSNLNKGKVFHLPSHHKNQAYLSLGWKFPVKSRQEIFNWRIINTLLGAGYTSLLNRLLREEKNITYLCTTRFNVIEKTGIFKINLALADKNLIEAIKLIECLIDDLKKGKIEEEIYSEAVIRHATHVVTRMEDSLNMAKLIGQFMMGEEGAFSFAGYLEELEKTNLSLAGELAGKHLINKNRKILIQTGSEDVKKNFPEILELGKENLGDIIF